MNEVTFKTIGDIFSPSIGRQTKRIVVPNYQRGYKWSVKHWNGKTEAPSALERLLEDFEMPCRNKCDYFLQGITVQERGNDVVLIDGQQRITTIYLLLWYIGGRQVISNIELDYDIRERSKQFLAKLKECSRENREIFIPTDSDEQDVYYFKQAILQIDKFFSSREELLKKENMIEYLKHHVRVIYIIIDTVEKAVRTFTMMNGAKANMLDEELIKAEILRLVSRPISRRIEDATISLDGGLELLRDICAEDWEITSLRGRYAREWDKWLYWWNRPEVRDFFNVNTPMGLLLDYFFKRGEGVDRKERFSFESFSKNFLIGSDSIQKT